MPITTYLQKPKKLEIQSYEPDQKLQDLRKTHIPFSGSPCKHPSDKDKFILVVDPYSNNSFYYEFDNSDVEYAKELSSIVNIDGETIPMVMVWVKKGSIGLRSIPFLVEDLSG